MIYLYIKQHEITGLKYFGMTTQDPYVYSGSGRIWRKHLQKHGHSIKTIDVFKFEEAEEASEFAINFSKQNNIVKSNKWANMIIETAKAEFPSRKGCVFSTEHRKKLSKAKIGKKRTPCSEATKLKMSLSNKGKHVGKNNTQYGTMWITDGICNAKIKREDVIPSGWTRGRTMLKR